MTKQTAVRDFRADRKQRAKEIRARVAANVAHLRSLRKMSQPELGTATGVGQSTISMIETGQRNAGWGTLEALSTALRIDMTDLIGRDLTPLGIKDLWPELLGQEASPEAMPQ